MREVGRSLLVGCLMGVLGLGLGCAKPKEPDSGRDVLGTIAAGVLESRFGVVVVTDQGNDFVTTPFVFLVPGTNFGWMIKLSDPDRTVSWSEELTLPSPGASVSGARQTDPTVFHREGREELEEGWLQKFWTLEEGDPMGRHVIHVFVEDELVRTFEFDVVPPPPQRDGTASQ